jgi:hypothetical protein
LAKLRIMKIVFVLVNLQGLKSVPNDRRIAYTKRKTLGRLTKLREWQIMIMSINVKWLTITAKIHKTKKVYKARNSEDINLLTEGRPSTAACAQCPACWAIGTKELKNVR